MQTKNDLIVELAYALGVNQAQIKLFVEAYARKIASALANDEDAILPNMGRLRAEFVPAHPGRNPATGEPMLIPEKLKIRFKPAKTFKQLVENP